MTKYSVVGLSCRCYHHSTKQHIEQIIWEKLNSIYHHCEAAYCLAPILIDYFEQRASTPLNPLSTPLKYVNPNLYDESSVCCD